MEYNKKFEEIVKYGVEEKVYIGIGNPNSKILLVGKEAAINAPKNDFERHNLKNYLNNAIDWQTKTNSPLDEEIPDWNINTYLADINATNNPRHSFKGVKLEHHREGQTWRKYQKLHDVIFNGDFIEDKARPYTFQNDFFLTEMNDNPEKTTLKAQRKEGFKEKLDKRRNTFFKSEFIQQFPVIILACGNYIINNENTRQIDNTFGVEYKSIDDAEGLSFWVHYGTKNQKLVIHTNQLSGSQASNKLLKAIGKVVREYIDENNLSI